MIYRLMYFTAPWCVPCRTFGPIMDDLMTKYPTVIYEKIDVDVLTDLAVKHEVFSVPTVIAFDIGDNEIGRFSGGRTYEFANNFIQSFT